MRHLSILLIALWPAPTTARAGDKLRPVVLIAPFENLSEARSPIRYTLDPENPERRREVVIDRYTQAPREILEDTVLSIGGLKVVERRRVDALIKEGEFGRNGGFTDPDKAVAFGKMLSAHRVVIGSILDIHAKEHLFQSNNGKVRTKTTKVRITVRVRVIDIKTGTVVFSRRVKGERQYVGSGYSGTSDPGVAYELIESALETLKKLEDFARALRGTKKPGADGTFEVEIAPEPQNCSIYLDEEYMGGSPMKLRLAGNKKVKIRIQKKGYWAWAATIRPRKGMKVTPDLDRRDR